MSLLHDDGFFASLEIDPAAGEIVSPAVRAPAHQPQPKPTLVPERQPLAPPAEATDNELMLRIGAGDRDAFTIFCRRHAGRCFSVATHLLRNASDAEEAVQDAFLRVWQNAGRWRATNAQVSTWLYRVVVNLCLDQMRRATRLSVSVEHAAEVVAADPSPEAIVGQRELAKVIARSVAQLPPRQRAALSLIVIDGLECAQAAQVMQVSVGTMESLLVRGRRQLRAAVEAAVRGKSG